MPCTFSSTFVYFFGLLLLEALIILPTIHTQEDVPTVHKYARNNLTVVNSSPLTPEKAHNSANGTMVVSGSTPEPSPITPEPSPITPIPSTPEPSPPQPPKAKGLVAALIAGASALILVSLVPWVWESYGNKRLVDVVDKKIGTNFDIKKMECLMIVGLWCAHPARNLRPSIRQAIQVLNFELPLPNLPSKMPVPNYDVPSSSTPAPALAATAMSGNSSLSLTVPR
ncbi:hypothetical protein QYF36_000474 [Acer negundo]|nr:hypothetical protein QYF36_000474 [Acer negundo]